MGVPAEAGDEPSADRCTDGGGGGCTTSTVLIESTSTGGDGGRGGSCVAADIAKESTVQGTLCQLLHCVRPPLQIIF